MVVVAVVAPLRRKEAAAAAGAAGEAAVEMAVELLFAVVLVGVVRDVVI